MICCGTPVSECSTERTTATTRSLKLCVWIDRTAIRSPLSAGYYDDLSRPCMAVGKGRSEDSYTARFILELSQPSQERPADRLCASEIFPERPL
ncbi:hypothetical protein PARPLA_03303 [Rhodobacteraceae bacterium THAF1]|nr:hypothetical protein FIU81_16660 [Palleronia sp. THAF1]VDC31425.1 hypothetical protein PARPLA_03303 [Rhodobacteraceae bacterium THAF1]